MGEIKLSPLAYLDMYRHCAANGGETSLIYGLLTGLVEDENTIIKAYIPLSHSTVPIDFEKNHGVFKQIEKYNADHVDPEYISEEILGWVRSFPAEEIALSEVERKNHVYMQTAYSDKAVAVFLPKSGDQFGMQVKHFKDPLPEIDVTSSLEDIDWNFGEIDDLDEMFNLILDINKRRNEKKVLIEEKFK